MCGDCHGLTWGWTVASISVEGSAPVGVIPAYGQAGSPGHCCLSKQMARGPTMHLGLGRDRGAVPAMPRPPSQSPRPTLYACRTPPLSAMFSPSVLKPFTCTQETGWRAAPPPGRGVVWAGPRVGVARRGRAHVLLLRQLPGVVPVLVDHALRLLPEVLGREVAPPVQHVAVLVEVPAWVGTEAGCLAGPASPAPASPACPLGGLSDQSPRWLAENRPAQSVSEPLWFNGPSWCPDSNLWVRAGLVPGDMGCSRKGPVVKLCERTSLLGLQLEPLGLVTGH